MKIKIDASKMTIGDAEDFEDITGLMFNDVMSNKKGEERSMPIKAVTALIYINKRREDPSFTLEMVRELDLTSLEIEVIDSSANPQSGEG